MSDQEDKDRLIEELRRLRRGLEDKDRAARLEDKDRAARFEELRFAKKQQWYIATSAVTLLAAIFGIAHITEPAKLGEKGMGTVFVAAIVYFAWKFLRQLQDHLAQTRNLLDPNDSTPFRGVDILAVLTGIVVISGSVVVYYLWRQDLLNLVF